MKSNRIVPDSGDSSGRATVSNNESESLLRNREQWSNPVEFLLSCISMSVGLGNVWRFPFTAYENGGGVFLLPYLMVLLFIGRPLYFMELVLGQFSSRSSVKIWSMVPAMRGVGYGQMIACVSVLSYYTLLVALSLYYLLVSLTSNLPWMACDQSLERPGIICIDSGNVFGGQADNVTTISAAEQFFVHGVLNQKLDISNGLGTPSLKLTLSLVACWSLIFLTLWQGVASSGKVAYFTALFPYAVLAVLLVRGLTLPGAMAGLQFYLTPKWSAFLEPRVWYAAVTQSFFSLAVGMGSVITYGSYNDFRHNVHRDAVILAFTDTFTSFLAGLVIFSILGNLAEELGVPIDSVIKSGAGIAFITYPTALGKIKFLPQLFSVLFFLMLITLGLGTSIGMMSGVIAVVHDDFPTINKTHITAVLSFCGLLLSIVYATPGGQHMVTLIDFFGGGFLIFAMVTLEVIAILWCYGTQRLIRDVNFMMGMHLGAYWKICWGFICPVTLTLILIYSLSNLGPIEYAGRPFPQYALNIGHAVVGVAFLQVPLWTLIALFQQNNKGLEMFKSIWRPSDAWGPHDSKLRAQWLQAEEDHHSREKTSTN